MVKLNISNLVGLPYDFNIDKTDIIPPLSWQGRELEITWWVAFPYTLFVFQDVQTLTKENIMVEEDMDLEDDQEKEEPSKKKKKCNPDKLRVSL